jgi:hypothetical protein
MLAKMEDQYKYDTKNIQDTPKQITQFQCVLHILYNRHKYGHSEPPT